LDRPKERLGIDSTTNLQSRERRDNKMRYGILPPRSSSLIPLILPLIASVVVVINYDYGAEAFISQPIIDRNKAVDRIAPFAAAKGFGAASTGDSSKKKGKKRVSKKSNRLADSDDRPRKMPVLGKPAQKPYVKSEQDAMIEQLAVQSSKTSIGRSVAEAQRELGDTEIDPFWELMPSLIQSRFPVIKDNQLERVAGMVKHALLSPDNQSLLDQNIIDDPWRPHNEIHAYMPNLGETKPFWDTNELTICKRLNENYESICDEYKALLEDRKDRFQSVTSMNYDSGWKTLVLFYNGHRVS
jgi:hypothetical protein